MNGISESSDRSDTLETFDSGTLSVGTSAVEAKVGGSRFAKRQALVIYNLSNDIIYRGKSNVTTTTGIPIFKDQVVTLPAGDVAVYLIAGSASNTVVIEEWAGAF